MMSENIGRVLMYSRGVQQSKASGKCLGVELLKRKL